MPATDHRIDGYPFSYPVVIDVVAYRVDDTEKFMAYVIRREIFKRET